MFSGVWRRLGWEYSNEPPAPVPVVIPATPEWQQSLLQLLGEEGLRSFLDKFETLRKAIPTISQSAFTEKISNIVTLIAEKRGSVLVDLQQGKSTQVEHVRNFRKRLSDVQFFLADRDIALREEGSLRDTLGMLGDPLYFSQAITDGFAELVEEFKDVKLRSTEEATLTRVPRLEWKDNEGRTIGGGPYFQGHGHVARASQWIPIKKNATDCPLEWEVVFYIPGWDRLGARIRSTIPVDPNGGDLQTLITYTTQFFRAKDPQRYKDSHPYEHAEALTALYKKVSDGLCLVSSLVGDFKKGEVPTPREQFAFLYGFQQRAKVYLEPEQQAKLEKLVGEYFSLTDASEIVDFWGQHRVEVAPLLFLLFGDDLYVHLWEELAKKNARSEEEEAAFRLLFLDPKLSYPEELFRLWRKKEKELYPLIQTLMGEELLYKHLIFYIRTMSQAGMANAAFFWSILTTPTDQEPVITVVDSYGMLPWYERIGRLGDLTGEACHALDRALEELPTRELILWVVEVSEKLPEQKIAPLQAFLDHMTEANRMVLREYMEAELPPGQQIEFMKGFPIIASMVGEGLHPGTNERAVQQFIGKEFQGALGWIIKGRETQVGSDVMRWYVERITAYNGENQEEIERSNRLIQMIVRLNKLGKLEQEEHAVLYRSFKDESKWEKIEAFLTTCEALQGTWEKEMGVVKTKYSLSPLRDFLKFLDEKAKANAALRAQAAAEGFTLLDEHSGEEEE